MIAAMTKLAFAHLIALGFLGLSTSVRAEEVKLTGEGACAKCVLKMPSISKCQNAITVIGADGKKEVILMEHNGKSKDFHDAICLHTAKIKAEGNLTEQNGQKLLVPTKLEEAK